MKRVIKKKKTFQTATWMTSNFNSYFMKLNAIFIAKEIKTSDSKYSILFSDTILILDRSTWRKDEDSD